MTLTSAGEASTLREYEPFLKKQVQSFIRRTHVDFDNFDDLLQEARLAFLCHIRSIDSEDQIMQCRYQILNALYEYCVEMAPVRIPIHRFKEVVNTFESIPLEYAENTSSDNSFEEDVEMQMMYASFFSSLPDVDKRIVEMKRKGCSGKEIADVLGYSLYHVSRRFSRVKQKMIEYFEEGARSA